MAIDNKKDLEEYMYELLDKSNPKNRKFVDELLRRWKQPERQVSVPQEATVRRALVFFSFCVCSVVPITLTIVVIWTFIVLEQIDFLVT